MKRTVVLNRYKDTAFAWHRYMASGAVMLNSVADFAQHENLLTFGIAKMQITSIIE